MKYTRIKSFKSEHNLFRGKTALFESKSTGCLLTSQLMAKVNDHPEYVGVTSDQQDDRSHFSWICEPELLSKISTNLMLREYQSHTMFENSSIAGKKTQRHV